MLQQQQAYDPWGQSKPQQLMGGEDDASGLQQHQAYGGDAYASLASPGVPSPMSMELTNDTLQTAAAAAAAAGSSAHDMALFGVGESTHNITDSVPGLSTLVEEDEEELVYGGSPGGGGSPSGDEMELTGATGVAMEAAAMQSALHRRHNHHHHCQHYCCCCYCCHCCYCLLC